MRIGKPRIGLLIAGLLAAAFVGADEPDGAMLGHTCAGCHGTYGVSEGQAPVIGGMSKSFIRKAMHDYRSGERHSTIMARLARGYSDEEIAAMAGFFADQEWVSADEDLDPKEVKRGKELHTTRGCVGCHGPKGISSSPLTPRLAGQYSEYLEIQMDYYRDPDTAVPSEGIAMRGMLSGMSDEDVAALAAFYASQQ